MSTQVPTNGKLQILGFVAFLEFFGELGGRVGAPAHYMRGGLPGAYPSFKKYLNGVFPHPVPLDLYDPFGIFSNASPEKKARGRLIEINNGRLAMIGLFLCGNENFTARSPPRWRGDVGSSPLDGISVSAPDSLVDFHRPLRIPLRVEGAGLRAGARLDRAPVRRRLHGAA